MWSYSTGMPRVKLLITLHEYNCSSCNFFGCCFWFCPWLNSSVRVFVYHKYAGFLEKCGNSQPFLLLIAFLISLMNSINKRPLWIMFYKLNRATKQCACWLSGICSCQPNIIRMNPSERMLDVVVSLLLLPSAPRYQRETLHVAAEQQELGPDRHIILPPS